MAADTKAAVPPEAPPRGRLLLGGAVFFGGFVLCPMLVPLVAASSLPTAWKTALSGLLLLGIPEIFMIVAAAVLGKQGYEYLKQRFFGLLKRVAPADHVSRGRYRFGLVLFLVPLLWGWAAPYVEHLVPNYDENRLAVAIVGDVMLVSGLFVLGGEFWDKLRSLFIHRAS